MSYYRICPDCGAALDPSESCDCKEKTVASAATLTTAKVEHASEQLKCSASDFNKRLEEIQV